MLAKRELRYKRKVAQTIAMVRIRGEWTKLRAAWVVQSAYRCYRARRELRRLRAGLGREIITAAWRLQRAGRAYAVRQALCAERAMIAALVVRAVSHAAKTRDEYVTVMQRWLRPHASHGRKLAIQERHLADRVDMWRGMRQVRRDDGHATQLQRAARGYAVRSRTMPALARAAAALARLRFEAARTIQCAWKSSQARDARRAWREARQRQLARLQVREEVQALLHADRVAALALSEQSARLAIARAQRAWRRDVLRLYFAGVVSAEGGGAGAGAVRPQHSHSGGGSRADAPAPQLPQPQLYAAAAPSRPDSAASSVAQRVLDMYDGGSEDEDRAGFVHFVLAGHTAPPARTST